MTAIPKYLERYAEAEARDFSSLPQGEWKRVVVLPLTGELSPELFDSLETAASHVGLPTLAIAVVNEREDSPARYKEKNAKLLEWLARRSPSPLLTIHVVDKTGPRCFPPKEGVGLARKLGCDIALAVAATTSPYLWTTDGDAKVAPDYFDLSGETSEAAALLSPFQHTTDDTTEGRALHAYDQYLHYYRRGLAYAGSPYAFHTIGSTISVTPEAYAQVRGFPKREAGEDFYLLNKVAKVGKVKIRQGGMVTLSQRSSLRVPFGTGASTVDITSLFESDQPFLVYHPRCFDLLKEWLHAVSCFAETGDVEATRKQLSARSPELTDLLDFLKSFEILETARKTRSGPQARLTHCHESFDAFRTLKFIHAARDKVCGKMEWKEAVDKTKSSFEDFPATTEPSPHPRSCEAQARTQA